MDKKGGERPLLDLQSKTYQNLLAEMLEQIPNRFDKREGGMLQTALGPAAYALEEYYLVLDQVQRAGFVQTAVGESLEQLAAIAGLSRREATPAVRLGVMTGAAAPMGARFSTMNGADSINFVVSAATDTPGQYQLTAETAGSIGNGYAGSILPITYIPGLTAAELTDILVPGDDLESDEELRERLITALNEQPFGGNVASYRAEIGAMAGVGAVQVYPTWAGGGTVKCSILGADLLPASSTLVEQVQNAIDPPPDQGLGLGLAPIGAKVTVAAPAAVEINVSAAITLAAGYEMAQVQEPVEAAVETYLLAVRQDWATPTVQGGVAYGTAVYVSRVLAAILSTPGVVNATEVQLNGAEADIILTETGALQQVPTLGTVSLHVAAE